MSLRSKIVLILLVVATLYAAVDNGVLRLFAKNFFGNWEMREGKDSLGTVLVAFENEARALEAKGRIWSNLEGVERFATEADPEFIEDNLGPDALASSDVDVFYICDADGNVLWRGVRDSVTGSEISLRKELPGEQLSGNHPLRLVREDAEVVSGLMMTEHLPLLVCSTAISLEDGEAFLPANGTRFREARFGFVILGRFLDDEMLEAIGSPSNMDISVHRLDEIDLNSARADMVAALTASEASVVSEVGEDGRLHLFASLNDVRTQLPLLVHGIADRDIVAVGTKAVNYALLSTVASALLIVFVLLLLLRGVVLVPLSTLATKAIEIGQSDDPTIRLNLERNDEIGQLSTEFDGMLEKLAQSRAQVVKTARLAGMSEIATGVLHNVGNVLNSVNVSSTLVSKSAKQLAVKDLEMMVGVLKENEADIARFVSEDPRGKHLLPFLYEVTSKLVDQRGQLLKELGELSSGIDHIADLVRSQQSYAGTRGVFELASLENEVDAAVRICDQALGRLGDVELVREFEELPSIRVDKHKLMEILVNLIQNAHQALAESEVDQKRLTLRIMQASNDIVRIEVEDNGVGIEPELIEKVFNHGFTTKSDGHGFGLHVSANAATEMKSSLHARSEGLGKGTTFYLDISTSDSELASAA